MNSNKRNEPSLPYSAHFGDRLTSAIKSKRTPLVVGIDPRWEQLPSAMRASIDPGDWSAQAAAFAQFGCEIIDAVAALVPAVKPQAAFFEQLGPAGMSALATVVDHAQRAGLVVIMDAKRGDIGSTAEAYAAAFLGAKPSSAWGCDCLTVNPYLGYDTLEPFVSRANATGSGLFVLAKTSNPGSGSIQEQLIGDRSIYDMVAAEIQRLAEASVGELGYGNIGAVVGATYPEQLSRLRSAMPNSMFLIPGFGAQGGTASDVAGGLDSDGLGGVINSSRGIIFAYNNPQYEATSSWQAAVELATRDTIEVLATGTPAGRLR